MSETKAEYKTTEEKGRKDDSLFKLNVTDLQKFIDPKNKEALDLLGGLPAIISGLRSDTETGLKVDENFGTVNQADAVTEEPNPLLKVFASCTGGAGAAIEAPKTFIERSRVFGRNRLPPAKELTLFQLMLKAMEDRILILLTIAAFVSLGIGLFEDFAIAHAPGEPKNKWIEGVVIIIAVLIVVLVSSINNYQKEKQFRKLNAQKENRQVRAIRDGQLQMLSVFDIQVGDIMTLEPGDLIAVDGVVISCHNLKCDESSATGESDLIRKQAYSTDPSCKDPFILSGSKVSEGVGKFIVTAVGPHSFNGKTLMGLRVEVDDTPLQVKLDALAENIAKLGISASVLILLVLLIRYLVVEGVDGNWPSGAAIGETITNIVIQAIVIIVVAVPEGLPLAVTLALAYATRRMLEDNNLVRVLASCETMGGATTVCSDKTGTLTQNKMTVVSGLLGLRLEFEEESGIKKVLSRLQSSVEPLISMASVPHDLLPEGSKSMSRKEYLNLLNEGNAVNATAFEEKDANGKVLFIGSKTETALLEWSRKLGLANFMQVRHDAESSIVQVFPFSSDRKNMTTVLKRHNEQGQLVYRVYTKGASEIVLKFCKDIVVIAGDSMGFIVTPLNEQIRKRLLLTISKYAEQSLRTICVAYFDMTEDEYKRVIGEDNGSQSTGNYEEIQAEITKRLEKHIQMNLILLAIVGIEDPLREGVADAVAQCQKAGVFVRMVTGDNITTARAIATKCGIYMKGGIVMEGKVFRQLPKPEMIEILPRLQVLARSSPLDKQILVQTLKEMGETVAVTGDGTNDGPALKMADVGFSMGIAGTEVAKEASAIVLMDDNFSSIVKAMMWGRAVNDSVKKFLQFQLTVNVSAVLIAFISAISDSESKSVLTAVQLLWINLIMDSLAALALATDAPTEEVLNRRPESKRDPLITIPMWKMILGQAIYQVVAVMILLNDVAYRLFKLDASNADHKAIIRSFIFNVFVYFQIFNMMNCRRLDSHLNFFSGITKNRFFGWILIGVNICQVIIIQYGGIAFQTVPLQWYHWLVSLFVGVITIPVGVIIRMLPTWDGCTICNVDVGKPDNSRIIMTKERLQWFDTVGKVRTQLSVFRALRGNIRPSSPRGSIELKRVPSISSESKGTSELGVMSSMDALTALGPSVKKDVGFFPELLK